MVLLTKLFFLAVRQVSKPLANSAKRAAKNSEAFRAGMVAVGRSLHRFNQRISRAAEGKIYLAHTAPLDEALALDRGSEVLSEGIIYAVAGSTIFYEYRVAQRKDEEKKQLAHEELQQRRREAADNERRQWQEFSELRQRITVAEQRLWDLQRLQQQQLEQMQLDRQQHDHELQLQQQAAQRTSSRWFGRWRSE